MRLILIAVCLILCGGYYLLTGWYPDAAWLQQSMFQITLPSIVFLAVLFVAFGLPGFGRKDPAIVLWAGIGLAGCVLSIPLLVAKFQQTDVDAMRTAELKELRKDLRVELARQAAIRRAEAADRVERTRTSDRFAQYEGRLPADQLDSLRELDQGMLDELDEYRMRYEAALEANPTMGPDDWVRYKSKEDLDEQHHAHKVLYEQTRAFTQYISTFEETYSRGIAGLDLPDAAHRVAIAELQRILLVWNQTRMYDLRTLDVEVLGAALRAIDLLRNDWGNWRFDHRINELIFDNPDTELAFIESVADMQAILQEVQSIREGIDEEEE
ncbi:MAG: hypothetical protein AB3N63_03650 [Puniceicoccaceae bacterium]